MTPSSVIAPSWRRSAEALRREARPGMDEGVLGADQRQLVGVLGLGHGEDLVQRATACSSARPGVAPTEVGAEEQGGEGVARAPDADRPARVADEPGLVCAWPRGPPARRAPRPAGGPVATTSTRPAAPIRSARGGAGALSSVVGATPVRSSSSNGFGVTMSASGTSSLAEGLRDPGAHVDAAPDLADDRVAAVERAAGSPRASRATASATTGAVAGVAEVAGQHRVAAAEHARGRRGPRPAPRPRRPGRPARGTRRAPDGSRRRRCRSARRRGRGAPARGTAARFPTRPYDHARLDRQDVHGGAVRRARGPRRPSVAARPVDDVPERLAVEEPAEVLDEERGHQLVPGRDGARRSGAAR